MTGPEDHQFEIYLGTLNIRHAYTVMPGTHSMFVWRPALANFLQEIPSQGWQWLLLYRPLLKSKNRSIHRYIGRLKTYS